MLAAPDVARFSEASPHALCQASFDWPDEVVRALARTSIDASFAGSEVKQRMAQASDRR
jgi:hypothetical protein